MREPFLGTLWRLAVGTRAAFLLGLRSLYSVRGCHLPMTSLTERKIAAALIETPKLGRSLLVIPNCGWTGHEADLLVIEPGLRIIDVEIKISRADLKADYKKDKWWVKRPWSRRPAKAPAGAPRIWPQRVWKHYYVCPLNIWDESLLGAIPPASGVLLMSEDSRYRSGQRVDLIRRARPNPEARAISPTDAIDLARLANLRMWAALRKDISRTATP